MKKKREGRSNKDFLEALTIELSFKEEIEENNIFMIGAVTYFFGVLLACLTEAVERYLGIILILTAILIIWYIRDRRKEIRRNYVKQIELLKEGKD